MALFCMIKMLETKHSESNLITTTNPIPINSFLDLNNSKWDVLGFLKEYLKKVIEFSGILAG